MSSQRTAESYKGLLGAITMGVGWALFILFYGVDSYAQGAVARPWPFVRPDSHDGGLVLFVLSVVCLLSSFLVGSFIDNLIRYDTPVRWLPWLGFALTFVPLLGLYAVPFWSWLVEAKPSWAFVEPGCREAENRALAGALRISRGWYLRVSNIFLFSILAVNAVALQALLAWLLSPDWPIGLRSEALGGAKLALRTTGFIATLVSNLLFYRWKRISPRAFPFAVLCSLAWLTPWPFYAIALSSTSWMSDKEKKPLLSTIAYGSRAQPSKRLEKGGSMDWWKPSLWQRWRFGWLSEVSRTRTMETQLTLLYRAKTFLLILDAAALVLVLGRFARNRFALEAGTAWVTRFAVNLSRMVPDSAVLLLPILLFLVARGAEVLCHPRAPDRLLPWRYLLLTFGAVVVGAEQGALLLGGYDLDLAVSFLRIGYAGSMTGFVMGMPFRLKGASRPETLSSIVPWLMVFLSMFWIGQIIVDYETLAPGILSLRVLRQCAQLSPAWALAAGLAWGKPLIAPFRMRDLLSRRLMASSRAMFAFLVLSSVLPFGGLATPLWRQLRSRLLRDPLYAGKV